MMMNIGIQVANQIIIIIIIMNIKTKNEKRKLNSSQESLHSITVYSFENELIRTEYNESNVTTVIMQMRKNIFQLCEKVDDNFFFFCKPSLSSLQS